MLELGKIKSFKSVNEVIGELKEITVDVKVDNREVSESSLFIAIVGERFNPLKKLPYLKDEKASLKMPYVGLDYNNLKID